MNAEMQKTMLLAGGRDVFQAGNIVLQIPVILQINSPIFSSMKPFFYSLVALSINIFWVSNYGHSGNLTAGQSNGACFVRLHNWAIQPLLADSKKVNETRCTCADSTAYSYGNTCVSGSEPCEAHACPDKPEGCGGPSN